jgi:uncharacterized protein (TIGR03663 family)
MTGTVGDRSEQESRWTVELLLYGLTFALALALRLVALERWPLLDEEAGLALAAWRLARGIPALLRGHSPLLFHANALLFFLTGGSDGLARICCVLFGSLIVLLPYGLRRYLGRIGALAASVLLAVSPSFVYFSRAVDGSVVVAFCGLGLLVVLAGVLERGRPTHVLAAASLLIVALLAGASAYTLLAVLLTFPFFVRIWARFSKKGAQLEELRRVWHDLFADPGAWRRALSLAAVLLLGAGLAFTYNPAGLQMALDQLGRWLGGFDFLGSSPWYRVLLLLLLYEALPLFLGIAGFVSQRGHFDTLIALLRYWFVFALFFSVLPGYRPPSSVLLVLVPLVLTAGQAVQRLWQELQETARQPLFWVLVVVSLVVCAIAYVHLVGYLSVPLSPYQLRIAALGVFLVSTYAFVWSLSGPEVPGRAAVVSLMLVLLLLWVRAEVRLNYARARDPAEPMVGVASSPDVLALAREAAELSSHLAGDERSMAWQVDKRLEVPLGWYLRGFEQVSYVTRTSTDGNTGGVIALADAPAPADYVGLRFGLRSAWAGGRYPAVEWVRWWAGLNSALEGQQLAEAVVLWVKQPLQ